MVIENGLFEPSSNPDKAIYILFHAISLEKAWTISSPLDISK